MQEENQKIREYILDFCESQEEPLHILLGALLDEGLYIDTKRFSIVFMDLYKHGYIEIERIDEETQEWPKVTDFREKDLTDYINENEKEKFEEYPEKEYFVITTQAGISFYKDNYM